MEILELCILPINRTNIMYGARINYKKSMKFLLVLVDKGLINPSNPIEVRGSEYLINTEGIKILNDYRKIKNLLSEIEDKI